MVDITDKRAVEKLTPKIEKIKNASDLKRALEIVARQYQVYAKRKDAIAEIVANGVTLHAQLQRELVGTHSALRRFINKRDQILNQQGRRREAARRVGGQAGGDLLAEADEVAKSRLEVLEAKVQKKMGSIVLAKDLERQIAANRNLTPGEERILRVLKSQATKARSQLRPLIDVNGRMLKSSASLLRQFSRIAGVGSVSIGKMDASSDIRTQARKAHDGLKRFVVALEGDLGVMKRVDTQLGGVINAASGASSGDIDAGDLTYIFGAAAAMTVLIAGTGGAAGFISGALLAAALVSKLVDTLIRFFKDIRAKMRAL